MLRVLTSPAESPVEIVWSARRKLRHILKGTHPDRPLISTRYRPIVIVVESDELVLKKRFSVIFGGVLYTDIVPVQILARNIWRCWVNGDVTSSSDMIAKFFCDCVDTVILPQEEVNTVNIRV